uniref:Uncharacterized protein n=1 Tax=Zea mays TaxID=4577 RepID=C4J7Y5_MAIZE|nr:unknown [Zea mays]
MGASRRLTW